MTRATRSTSRDAVDDTPPPPIKIQEVKGARALASEITQAGAKVYDLLSAETKNRQERLRALRFLDTSGSSSGDETDILSKPPFCGDWSHLPYFL